MRSPFSRAGVVYEYPLENPKCTPQLLMGLLSMMLDMTLTSNNDFLIVCDRDEKVQVSSYPDCYNVVAACLGHQFVTFTSLALHVPKSTEIASVYQCSSSTISDEGATMRRVPCPICFEIFPRSYVRVHISLVHPLGFSFCCPRCLAPFRSEEEQEIHTGRNACPPRSVARILQVLIRTFRAQLR